MSAGLRGAFGRYGSAAGLAGLAVLGLGVLVAKDVTTLLTGVIGALFLVALLLGYTVARRLRGARRTSATIDFVASRLLHVESRLTALDRARAGTVPDGHPAELAEVLADLSLLSDLVRSLAEAMSAQEQEIAELRARLDEVGGERVASLPSPPRPARMADRPAATHEAAPLAPEARPAPAKPSAPRIVPSLLPQSDDAPMRTLASDPVQAEARRSAIVAALEAGEVELQLQAIVTLPQRRARLYEVSPRLRLTDDTLLSPPEFMPALERLGRAAEIDRQVVGRALALAAQMGERDPEMRLSCNVSAASLRDGETIAALEQVVAARPDAAGRLVFEVPQRVWRALPAEATTGIDRLRALGIAFAVDQATDLRLEGLSLGANGVTLVKLPASLLLGAMRPGDDPGPIAQLQPLLAQHGVQIVAERVDRDADIPDLIDLGIGLAQGGVFGAPHPLPAEFGLSEQADGPGIAVDGPDITDMADPNTMPAEPAAVPFRAFLRRAG